MAEEDGAKQGAIGSDGSINQNQWMNEPDFGAPTSPPPMKDWWEERTKPDYPTPTYRVGGGKMLSPPSQRGLAETAYKMSELYPELRNEYLSIAGGMAVGQRELLTKEDIQRAEDPSFWESLGTLLEPFTTPQRAAWYAGLSAGEYLPDPGTTAGDLTQDIVGTVGGATLATAAGILEAPALLWDAVFGDEKYDSGTPSTARAPAEEIILSFSDMIENLYGDISTGKLKRRSEENMRPWLWGDWSSAPAPTGDMIMDSLISYQAAEYLSRNGETAVHRKFGDWMSNDMGRLIFGVGLEIVADPLWFVGPGKAANLVAHGKDFYKISNTLMKAAGKMELLDKVRVSSDFRKVMVSMMVGSADEIADAEKVVDTYATMAMKSVEQMRLDLKVVKSAIKETDQNKVKNLIRSLADDQVDATKTLSAEFAAAGSEKMAKRAAADADNLRKKLFGISASPEKAKAWLENQLRIIPLEMRNKQGIADELQDVIGYAADARKAGPKSVAGGAKKTGGLAWHIPLTNKNGYLLPFSPLNSATELIRRVEPIRDFTEKWSLPGLNKEIQLAITNSPTTINTMDALGGNATKYFAWAMQNAATWPVVFTAATWDMFRRTFGTRFLQPMTQTFRKEVLKRYDRLPSIAFQSTTVQRLKKVHPVVWQEYQDGLTKMMEGYAGLESTLRNTVLRLYEKAGHVLESRRKRSVGEVERLTELLKKTKDPNVVADLNIKIREATRWASGTEYSITNIMNEAGSAIESSAGKYANLSDDVQEVSESLKGIIKTITDDPTIAAGKIEVEQSLIQMARLAKGSQAEKANILANLRVVDEALSSLNLERAASIKKVRTAFRTRIAQIDSVRSVLSGVSTEALARALLFARNTYEPDVLLGELTRIFGTEESARLILRNTAIAMGSTDGYKGFRMLAEKLTGDLKSATVGNPVELRKAIGTGIRNYLDGLDKQRIVLKNAAFRRPGAQEKLKEFIPGLQKQELDSLIDGLIEKEDLSWKILVPKEERQAFIQWAKGVYDPSEGILQSLLRKPPEVESKHWMAAFNFYRRSRGLEKVKKLSSASVKETDFLHFSSRHARDEMYRLADAAEAEGAIVSKRYVDPSPWRRKAGDVVEEAEDLRPTVDDLVDEVKRRITDEQMLADDVVKLEAQPSILEEPVPEFTKAAPDLTVATRLTETVQRDLINDATSAIVDGPAGPPDFWVDGGRYKLNEGLTPVNTTDPSAEGPSFTVYYMVKQSGGADNFAVRPGKVQAVSGRKLTPEEIERIDTERELALIHRSGKYRSEYHIKADPNWEARGDPVEDVADIGDQFAKQGELQGQLEADLLKKADEQTGRSDLFTYTQEEKLVVDVIDPDVPVATIKYKPKSKRGGPKDAEIQDLYGLQGPTWSRQHIRDEVSTLDIDYSGGFQADPEKSLEDLIKRLDEAGEPLPTPGTKSTIKTKKQLFLDPEDTTAMREFLQDLAKEEAKAIRKNLNNALREETSKVRNQLLHRQNALKKGQADTQEITILKHQLHNLETFKPSPNARNIDEILLLQKNLLETERLAKGTGYSATTPTATVITKSTREVIAKRPTVRLTMSEAASAASDHALFEHKGALEASSALDVHLTGSTTIMVGRADTPGTELLSETKDQILSLLEKVKQRKKSQARAREQAVELSKGYKDEAARRDFLTRKLEFLAYREPSLRFIVSDAESNEPLIKFLLESKADITIFHEGKTSRLTPQKLSKMTGRKHLAASKIPGKRLSEIHMIEDFGPLADMDLFIGVTKGKDGKNGFRVYDRKTGAPISSFKKPTYVKDLKGVEPRALRERLVLEDVLRDAQRNVERAGESYRINRRSLELVDDAKRIKESAGSAVLYPTRKSAIDLHRADYTEYLRSVNPSMSKSDLDKLVDAELAVSFGKNEKEFLALRASQMDRYIEEPVKRLVKKVLDEGNIPVGSNAYNEGMKGVWFVTPEKLRAHRALPLESVARVDKNADFYRLSDNELKALFKDVDDWPGDLEALDISTPVNAALAKQDRIFDLVDHVEHSFSSVKDFDRGWAVIDVKTGRSFGKADTPQDAITVASLKSSDLIDFMVKDKRSIYGQKKKPVFSRYVAGRFHKKSTFSPGEKQAIIDQAIKESIGKGPEISRLIKDADRAKASGAGSKEAVEVQAKLDQALEAGRGLTSPLGERPAAISQYFPENRVLLARDPSKAGKPLSEKTKRAIKHAHGGSPEVQYYDSQAPGEVTTMITRQRDWGGAKFIVGDDPRLDQVLIDYLDDIGADYTIYHSGPIPRVKGRGTGPYLPPPSPRPFSKVPGKPTGRPPSPEAELQKLSRTSKDAERQFDELLGPDPTPEPTWDVSERVIPRTAFNPLARKRAGLLVQQTRSPAANKPIKTATDNITEGFLGKGDLASEYKEDYVIWKNKNKKDIDRRTMSPDPDGLFMGVIDILQRLAKGDTTAPFPYLNDVVELETLLRDLNHYAHALGKHWTPSKDLAARGTALVQQLMKNKAKTNNRFYSSFIDIMHGLSSGGQPGATEILTALGRIKSKYGDSLKLSLPVLGSPLRRPMGPKGMTMKGLFRTGLGDSYSEEQVINSLEMLLTRDVISDPEMRKLLAEISKRANIRDTILQSSSQTLKKDMEKIRAEIETLVGAPAKPRSYVSTSTGVPVFHSGTDYGEFTDWYTPTTRTTPEEPWGWGTKPRDPKQGGLDVDKFGDKVYDPERILKIRGAKVGAAPSFVKRGTLQKDFDPVEWSKKSADERAAIEESIIRAQGGEVGKLFEEARETRAVARKSILDKDRELRKSLRDELEKYREEAKKLGGLGPPKLPPRRDEKGNLIGARDYDDWEKKLWTNYLDLIQKHKLSHDDQMFAAFSVLREMPSGISDDMTKKLAEKYPQIIGRRFGDVATDLKPVMDEIESLIKTYEVEYAERGFDFVRSPAEMMERWAVTDYVPHLYKEMDELSMELAEQGMVQLGSGKGLAQLFFREMDASKKRGLSGTILELNSLNNVEEGTTNMIALDPSLIWSRYTQANHALTNEDFITTLVKTGVIRGLRVGDTKLADDFGISLTRADGVAKTVDEIAMELDMIPLFDRPNVSNKEMKNFLNAKLDDLLESFPDGQGSSRGTEVSRAIDSIRKSLEEKPAKGFATWVVSSHRVRALKQTEQATLRIRSLQAKAGEELFSPLARYEELTAGKLDAMTKRWDETTGKKIQKTLPDEGFQILRNRKIKEMKEGVYNQAWSEIAVEMNDLRNRLGASVPKLKGKYLSSYFDPDAAMWEMYIPRAVYQNMTEVIEMDPRVKGAAWKAAEKLNSWWKTRVTVIAVAFSARNWGANNVTMGFDLGLKGVLNPKTHVQGLKIANAARWVDKHGSLAEAWRILSKPLPKTAKAWEKTAHAASRASFRAQGLKGLLDNGVQLTDDVWMSADDLVNEMTRRGVISPAFTQVVDINAVEQNLLHSTLYGGANADAIQAGKLQRAVSIAEDVLLVTVPTAMTGGIPIALPKKIGAEIVARTVENQSRVFNFLANFKKTNSWSDATAHVNKFLFNYGDLTQVQKTWMRLLVPFFTWNQKNVLLQLELMQKSPKLFADFHRFMIDGIPQALEASKSESANERFVPYDPLSKERLRERETHYLHTIQLPMLSLENTAIGDISVPALKRKSTKGFFPWMSYDVQWGKLGKDYFPRLKNAQIKGLGLPQEALVNSLSLIMNTADIRNWPWLPLPGDLGKQQRAREFSSRSRHTRLLGETHFLLRAAVELGSRHHAFYDKPINELTDGRLIAETIGAIRTVPYVGDMMGDIMAQKMGLRGYTVWDEHSNSWKNFLKAEGSANHFLGSVPWSRSLRDAAALTDQFLLSRTIPRESLTESGILEENQEVPIFYSVFDSMTGAGIRQSDPKLMRYYADIRTEKQYLEYLESVGLLKEYGTAYVPYQ